MICKCHPLSEAALETIDTQVLSPAPQTVCPPCESQSRRVTRTESLKNFKGKNTYQINSKINSNNISFDIHVCNKYQMTCMICIGIPDARTRSVVLGFMIWASLITVRTSNDSACFETCQAHALTKLRTAAVPLHRCQGLKFNTNGFIVVNPTSLHKRIVDQQFFPQLTTFP